MVVNKEVVSLFLSEFLERVSPEDVAHEAMGWRLPETVNLQRSAVVPEALQEAHTLFRSSNVWSSGLNPPCIHRNCLFMTAAKGNAQKESMHASYTASEYLCLHSSLKVK
jgi:hypothetical protein